MCQKPLVTEELGRLKQQALQQFGGGNENLDPSILPDEMFQDQADKRVKIGLLAAEIIQQNDFKADEGQSKGPWCKRWQKVTKIHKSLLITT